MKLQAKVLLLVMVILLVTGILSGGTMLYLLRRASVTQFEQTATALANAVQGSLEEGMMLGERQHVQKAVVRVGEEKIVSETAIFSSDGIIAASSEVSKVGQTTDRSEVRQVLESGEPAVWTKQKNGQSELHIVMPIFNKAECQSCHSAGTTVLGATQVSLDTTLLDNQIRQQTIFFGALDILTLGVIGIGLAFVLRRIVLKPLLSLSESAQKLSQGDYAIRTRSDGNDEIGMLARTFNEMAESVEQRSRELEASRQELARWNTDLEQKIEQRTNQLSAFNTIISTVSQSLDLGWILDAALTKILSLMDVDAGMIHLLDRKSGRLDIVVHRGLSRESTQGLARLGVRDGTWGQVVQSGQPVVVNGKPDFHRDIRLNGERGEFEAGIILPMKSENRVQGTLTLGSYLPGRFQPELVRLLQSMSDAIGIGIANAIAAQNLKEVNRLREQLLEKLISAQEEERKRIARELHDEASQSLAALVLHLEDIADSLPARNQAAKQRLHVLKEQVERTLGGIRNLALDLRPSVLDHLGLSRAIEWYARDYLGKRGLDARVEITGPRTKLPSYTETMLFRIVQEALTNVVKHAQASKVGVRLEIGDSGVSVRIEDNGKGFDVDSALSGVAGQKNLGLHGMIERATLLGGTFNIHSEPGKGTSVSIEVPIIEGANVHEQDKGIPG